MTYPRVPGARQMTVSGRQPNPLSVFAGPPLPVQSPWQGAASSMSTTLVPSSNADTTNKTCAEHERYGDKQGSRQRSESVAPLHDTDTHSHSNNLGSDPSVNAHGNPTNDEETESDIFAVPPTPYFRTPSPIGPPSPMIPWEQSLNDYLSDQPLVNNTYRGLTPFPDHNFDDDISSAQSAANSEYCLDGSGNLTVDTVHGEPALRSPSSVASEYEHPSPRR